MTTVSELPTPALLLDVNRLDRNLERMAQRCRRLGVSLRPHIKTHKCLEIAERQRALGARGLTVSTLHEARVFADHGFDDITWAFPFILSRLDEAKGLAQSIRLRVVVDSPTAVEALERSGQPFHVWLKVDCGYHRAGVDPDSEAALDIAAALSRSRPLSFDGILTHSGHAYHCRSRGELFAVAEEERATMVAFAQRLQGAGIEVPAVSVGSTPAMSVVESLEGVSEARPGNYVFYDAMQAALGSCQIDDCAVSVLASVVSCPSGSDHAVVDAGALALSKDPGIDRVAEAEPSFGHLFRPDGTTALAPAHRLIRLSQEHGVVSGSLPVGMPLRIVPNHSCLAVANFDEYHVVRQERVVDHWRIWRGR